MKLGKFQLTPSSTRLGVWQKVQLSTVLRLPPWKPNWVWHVMHFAVETAARRACRKRCSSPTSNPSPPPASAAVPEGSDEIEYVLEDYYEAQGLWYEGTEFSGRSDYQAFIVNGIPSGGLFTGASEPVMHAGKRGHGLDDERLTLARDERAVRDDQRP